MGIYLQLADKGGSPRSHGTSTGTNPPWSRDSFHSTLYVHVPGGGEISSSKLDEFEAHLLQEETIMDATMMADLLKVVCSKDNSDESPVEITPPDSPVPGTSTQQLDKPAQVPGSGPSTKSPQSESLTENGTMGDNVIIFAGSGSSWDTDLDGSTGDVTLPDEEVLERISREGIKWEKLEKVPKP